jgi:hypothetical protein
MDSGKADYPLNEFRQIQSCETVVIGPYRDKTHHFIRCDAGELTAKHEPGVRS